MKIKKLTVRQTRSIQQAFTKWFLIISACSVSFFAGVELVLARLGLLGELDTMGKAVPVIFSSLVIIPVSFAIARLLLRYPMRPIKKLIQGMNRLAEGHFEERLDFGDVGPMKELADTFNKLASELQNTEMLRADFVNNFSHEFKTPIMSIHGFAELLMQTKMPEVQKEYVEVIASESKRLAHMATHVLNLTKIENQSILTNCSEYNLSEQLRKCILLLESKWTEKEITINADFDEHLVYGDAELLQQVWVNLLDNAIKFSPVGAEIGVSIANLNREIQVVLSNHGPMIPEEDHSRLFNKFWQGDTSHAQQGTGIGLAVVRKIVDLHSGAVDVSSSPEATIFTVRLPVRVPED